MLANKPLYTLTLQHKKLLMEVILPSIVLIIFFFLMVKNYVVFPASTLFGIALLPYVLVIRKTEGKSYRYIYVVFFLLLLVSLSGLNTLIYITFIATILLLIESSIGKTGILTFIYLIILSPIFMYIGNFVGVPARLELTAIAGEILNLIQMHNQVAGNLIITGKNEFSVEPACMGLNMLSISFILAIVLAAHYERTYNKKLNLLSIILYLLSVFVFNLIGNLVRIILLILFRIPADNYMHDVVGIVCLIIYVLLPLWFVSGFFYQRFASPLLEQKAPVQKDYARLINTAIVALFIIVVYISKMHTYEKTYMPTCCSISGYEKSITTNEVIRFENKEALIYVKPVMSFYGTEHTPMVCWVGSGYSFVQVKRIICNSKEIYTGKLIKGKDSIYCSWWFDNGMNKTIRQLEWRLDVMKGADTYSLINVNATDEKKMLTITANLLDENIFREK